MHTCVNVKLVTGIHQLAAIGAHGRRSQKNVVDHVTLSRTSINLAVSDYSDDPLDVVTAFKAYTEKHRAVRYGRAPIAAHILVSVSPELVLEAGDPHDPDNSINRLLFQQGLVWAGSVFGSDSVIAARLDCDEAGSGVLDLIVVPVRVMTVNRHASKTLISVSSALEEVRKAYKAYKSYSALQTSWAHHAQHTIDARLQRGTPREITQRFHVEHKIFRPLAEADAQRRESEQASHRAAMAADMEKMEELKKRLALEEAALAQAKDRLANELSQLAHQKRKLANLPKALSFCIQAYAKNVFTISADGTFEFELAHEVSGKMREKALFALEEGKQAGFSLSLVRSLENNLQVRALQVGSRGECDPADQTSIDNPPW